MATDALGSPVRCYRPETIGARDMTFVPSLGMVYYLNDRKELLGEQNVSLTLPDLSSTMNMRLKGLTKTKTETENKGRFKRFLEAILSDDE